VEELLLSAIECDVRQIEIHTTESLIPEPSPILKLLFQVEKVYICRYR
jgi:hypothetical protein